MVRFNVYDFSGAALNQVRAERHPTAGNKANAKAAWANTSTSFLAGTVGTLAAEHSAKVVSVGDAEIEVEGISGIQTEVMRSSIEDAWLDPATIEYYRQECYYSQPFSRGRKNLAQ
jgi:hypothetical protein